MKDEYYLAARVVLDVFIISTLKYLFLSTKRIKKKMKKYALIICLLMIALNIVGIYRNSFTVWLYNDISSYVWLFSDIIQLIYCAWVYFVILHNQYLYFTKTYISILFTFCVLIGLANIYNFIINFYWFNYEPFLVFVFWFLNNGLMVTFALTGCYLLVKRRKNARDF
jgi:hypothetical protein